MENCWCRLQYERTARPGALAAGKDRMRLQSRVQILDDEYEGYYMIGGPQITLEGSMSDGLYHLRHVT